MNINHTAPMYDEKIRRTAAAVEILTGHKHRKQNDDVKFIKDTYESTPDIEYYNNYSKEGMTFAGTNAQHIIQESFIPTEVPAISDNGAIENTKSDDTPDITAQNRWECPLYREMMDYVNDIYHKRAAESKGYADPIHHAWQRYYDPSARHYVGHDISDWEKNRAWTAERIAIKSGVYVGGTTGTIDPIFEGRGLGRAASSARKFEPYDCRRMSAGFRLNNRNIVTSQLNALLSRNGISIPDNLRLSFVIDSQYRLRITGSNDESLIRSIEELLNSNGNSKQLYTHILQSTRTVGSDRYSNQVRDDSLRMYEVDWAIREYTGYERKDLELVDGKFLTKDGVDIAELIKKGLAEHFNDSSSGAGILIQHTLNELEWLAKANPDNISEMVLNIDFENGNLYDVGQPYGYGQGQTDWIRDLLGGKDPHDSNSWL